MQQSSELVNTTTPGHGTGSAPVATKELKSCSAVKKKESPRSQAEGHKDDKRPGASPV